MMRFWVRIMWKCGCKLHSFIINWMRSVINQTASRLPFTYILIMNKINKYAMPSNRDLHSKFLMELKSFFHALMYLPSALSVLPCSNNNKEDLRRVAPQKINCCWCLSFNSCMKLSLFGGVVCLIFLLTVFILLCFISDSAVHSGR